jgi:hypothetical protein
MHICVTNKLIYVQDGCLAHHVEVPFAIGAFPDVILVENLCSHSTYIHNTNIRSLHFEQTLNSLQVDKV